MQVLDTHIWIWLLNGDERIKKTGFIPKNKMAGNIQHKDSFHIIMGSCYACSTRQDFSGGRYS